MRLSTLMAAALLASGAAPPADPPLETKIEAARLCLAGEAAAGRFSGVAAASEKGRPLLAAGFGFADAAGTRRNRLDTRFNIASAGKMLTAIAIGQLFEAKKLRFRDPVGRYLDGLPADVAKVTIDQLLTHRSGLGDYLRPENREAIRAATSAADLVPLAVKGGLAFAPGSRQAYSNSGYVLLGAVIERLSGLRYADYVRERIFAPAGMASASVDGEGERAEALTARRPDGSVGEERHPAPLIGGPRGSPAGGALASARDLLKLGEALRTHRLISAATEAAAGARRAQAGAGGEAQLRLRLRPPRFARRRLGGRPRRRQPRSQFRVRIFSGDRADRGRPLQLRPAGGDRGDGPASRGAEEGGQGGVRGRRGTGQRLSSRSATGRSGQRRGREHPESGPRGPVPPSHVGPNRRAGLSVRQCFPRSAAKPFRAKRWVWQLWFPLITSNCAPAPCTGSQGAIRSSGLRRR
jgi:CubicO group peptidase (beta-lactamase class C family)